MTRNDRWLTSLHEAGHATAALALNGACDGVLLTVDGGQAHCRDLLGSNDAYMTAAGPLAEQQLSEQFDPPQCTTVAFEDIASHPPATASRDFATWCMAANVEGINQKCVSDARSLARWAIDGHEDAPESWARRLKFVKHVASEIIAKNQAAVIRIARALYEHGALTGEQILNLYEGPNQNANE